MQYTHNTLDIGVTCSLHIRKLFQAQGKSQDFMLDQVKLLVLLQLLNQLECLNLLA